MRGRTPKASGAALLLSAGACVLTTPDFGAPLRVLREQQRSQAERVAAAFCAAYYACDCEERFPSHVDEDDCVEVITEGLVQRLEQGINDSLDYDPDCLEANATLYEGLGCTHRDDAALDEELSRQLDLALRCRTYDGTLTLNEECTPLASARGGECAPGLACDLGFQMCFELAPLAEGEPCGESCGPGTTCGDDLRCEALAPMICAMEATLP